MAEKSPQIRQADALEQIAQKIDHQTDALVQIKVKLNSLITAVRRNRH